jgi:peptidoglycan/LPS O-acetylase OafA/YrhL
MSDTQTRLAWVDRLKGFALLWIFINHAVEQTIGFPAFGNPMPGWPPLAERVRQLMPLTGHGVWDIPLNVFRYVGWLGDQGVGLFLLLAGFVLAWGMSEKRDRDPRRWREYYARRFFRIYPLWWASHGLVLVAGVLGLLSQPLSYSRFLLSFVGVRVDPQTFYAFSGSWWFVGLLVQLYLVFPLLWILLNRWGPARFLTVVIVLAVAVRGAAMARPGEWTDPVLRGCVFASRLPEFVLGMALAFWMQRDGDAIVQRLRTGGSLLLGLFLYLVGTGLSFTWPGMTVAPLLTSAGLFGLLFPAAARESGPRRGLLEWVGIHSYSFYLLQGIVLKRIGPSDLSGPRSVAKLVAAVVVTVVAGLLLEWGVALLEKAMNRLRGRPAPQAA